MDALMRLHVFAVALANNSALADAAAANSGRLTNLGVCMGEPKLPPLLKQFDQPSIHSLPGAAGLLT